MKNALLVFMLALLLPGVGLAGNQLENVSTIANDGTVDLNTQAPVLDPPTIADSPGTIIGETSYEYQTNGSTGNRITVDDLGGIHVSWTRGMVEDSRPRYVYYNFRSEETGLWNSAEGARVSEENGTGFTTLSNLGSGEAVVAYHSADATPSHCAVSVDAVRGFAIFNEYEISAGDGYIWPYISRDTNGRFHMIGAVNEGPPERIGYTYSADDGQTWDRWVVVRTIYGLGANICSSPVSPKTAIIFADTISEEYWDVFYVESNDGETWDFNNPVCITQYTSNDSVTAWPDVEGIYDYDDNLHIAYIQLDNYAEEEIGDLMHWSEATDNTVITSARQGCPAQNWIYYACVIKPSLGIDPDNGNFFAVWSEGSHDDVSFAGFANHDLFAAASTDNGATWFDKVNITNSPTPDCEAPDCDHDMWSSMAETVDSVLHIMYIDDNDAGAAWNAQGVWTINNVLYLEVEADSLIPTAIEDRDADLPFQFDLGQNYPNPFNARTLISLDGEVHSGNLAIYDVTGRMVRSFPLDENTRSVTWDGADASGQPVASGTYFYSVNFDDYGTAAVRKMTLLK
jgi:hypothetical protein